jgi:hypothetical protein
LGSSQPTHETLVGGVEREKDSTSADEVVVRGGPTARRRPSLAQRSIRVVGRVDQEVARDRCVRQHVARWRMYLTARSEHDGGEDPPTEPGTADHWTDRSYHRACSMHAM